MSRVESEAMIAIRETRRALTKLEFAAMDISCQNTERDLTAQLVALRSQTESAAITFNAT
jgi:hypothetical protein